MTHSNTIPLSAPSGKSVPIRQFLRYASVGGLAFIADWSALILLSERAHLPYLLAASIAFMVGLVVNYAMSIRWVFTEHRFASRGAEFVIYGVIGVAGVVLTDLILYGLVQHVGESLRVAKLIAAAVVLVFNFTVRKTLLFTRTEQKNGESSGCRPEK